MLELGTGTTGRLPTRVMSQTGFEYTLTYAVCLKRCRFYLSEATTLPGIVARTGEIEHHLSGGALHCGERMPEQDMEPGVTGDPEVLEVREYQPAVLPPPLRECHTRRRVAQLRLTTTQANIAALEAVLTNLKQLEQDDLRVITQ